MKLRMEYCWNDTDRGNRSTDINCSQGETKITKTLKKIFRP